MFAVGLGYARFLQRLLEPYKKSPMSRIDHKANMNLWFAALVFHLLNQLAVTADRHGAGVLLPALGHFAQDGFAVDSI